MNKAQAEDLSRATLLTVIKSLKENKPIQNQLAVIDSAFEMYHEYHSKHIIELLSEVTQVLKIHSNIMGNSQTAIEVISKAENFLNT